ncbi:MAG: hypothetical protein M3Y65_09280 [Pseudomonadota bacterium]|nr:hypothetical protein [Pseudomonadota bacterium]
MVDAHPGLAVRKASLVDEGLAGRVRSWHQQGVCHTARDFKFDVSYGAGEQTMGSADSRKLAAAVARGTGQS